MPPTRLPTDIGNEIRVALPAPAAAALLDLLPCLEFGRHPRHSGLRGGRDGLRSESHPSCATAIETNTVAVGWASRPRSNPLRPDAPSSSRCPSARSCDSGAGRRQGSSCLPARIRLSWHAGWMRISSMPPADDVVSMLRRRWWRSRARCRNQPQSKQREGITIAAVFDLSRLCCRSDPNWGECFRFM